MMESTSAAHASSVLQKYYAELLDMLGKNLNDILKYLIPEGMINIKEKNTIKQFGKSPDDRAEYLLDNHVDRQLSGGITDNFLKLLKVMQKIPACDKLSAEISKAIISDTLKTSASDPISDEASKIGKPVKRTHDISSDDDDSISLENQHSNGDEDYVPPKKHQKAPKEEISLNLSIAYIKAFKLEDYRKRFSEDDVESSFVYMLSRLEDLWSNVKFSKLKNTCKRDRRLSDELRNNLQSTTTLEEMFDLLSDSQFCTWLEIRILKCMAKVADVPEATSMLNIFEECVHSRKCSEVVVHFKKKYINPDHLTLVVSKLNKNAEDMIVADLIKYCYKQESILQLPPESITLVNSNMGCLEVHMVIPCYCSMYAYEVVRSRFFKLRPLNIQYLQIGSFPKVYITCVTEAAEVKSFLMEISSFDDGSHPTEVVNHYYTYLEGHMDADSVSHMMHNEHLITDSDYEAITAAPNDINMNRLLLQYVRAMDMPKLLKFCNLLKNIETQQCIGVNLETSVKSTEYNETTVSQSECVFTIPSKLMTNQFKEMNTLFLKVIDALIARVQSVDIQFLTDKCCTLMASKIHNIKLFTNSFIKKLFKCSHSNLLKIYLLPFNTFLDNTILRELLLTYEIDLELFCKFIHIVDDNESITSYPIPTFSQLIIPLDDSEYTIVAVKTFQNCNELILKDVKDVKKVLEFYWELTAHAIHLAAIDYSYNFIYWMIPKQVQPLVENKLSKGQHELWDRGIFITVLLPNDYFSANNYDQQIINNPFDVTKPLLKDSMKVCQLNLEDMKVHVNLLKEEISELKSQLELPKQQLESLNLEKKEKCDITVATDDVIQNELDIMRIHCNKLEEEKDDVNSKKLIVEKYYNILQVKHKSLIEKYATLRSQMSSYTTDVTKFVSLEKSSSAVDNTEKKSKSLKQQDSFAPKFSLEPVQVDSQQKLLEGVNVSSQLKQIDTKLDANIASHQKTMQIVQYLSQAIEDINERMESMEKLLDLSLENRQTTAASSEYSLIKKSAKALYENSHLQQKFNQADYVEVKLLAQSYSGDFWLAVSRVDRSKVVVKKPATTISVEMLGQEINALLKCKHPNVIQFIMADMNAIEQAFSLYFEYAQRGQLQSYLQAQQTSMNFTKLLTMAANIASGMTELEKHRVIHCDLKTSNILIDDDCLCKIASFNKAQCLKENEKYRICDPYHLSIRWQAPEVLNCRKFSTKSDVWSFGVVMAELFLYGSKPYPDMKDEEVKKFVLGKKKMAQPIGCPKEVYNIMKECFHFREDQRFPFTAVQKALTELQRKFFKRKSDEFAYSSEFED